MRRKPLCARFQSGMCRMWKRLGQYQELNLLRTFSEAAYSSIFAVQSIFLKNCESTDEEIRSETTCSGEGHFIVNWIGSQVLRRRCRWWILLIRLRECININIAPLQSFGFCYLSGQQDSSLWSHNAENAQFQAHRYSSTLNPASSSGCSGTEECDLGGCRWMNWSAQVHVFKSLAAPFNGYVEYYMHFRSLIVKLPGPNQSYKQQFQKQKTKSLFSSKCPDWAILSHNVLLCQINIIRLSKNLLHELLRWTIIKLAGKFWPFWMVHLMRS